MDSIRYIRAARLVLLTAYWAGAALTARVVNFRDASKRKLAVAGCMTSWSRDVFRALGIRVDYRGRYAPDRANFVVSNHVSYLDVLALSAAGPTVFIAKDEVRGWPVVGWLGALVGTIFIRRASGKSAYGSFSEMEDALSMGVSVAVFPEGTSTDGRAVLKFKSMFFDVPARLLMPVTPVSIRYSGGAALWHGDMELIPHLWDLLGETGMSVTARFNPPIYPQDVSLDRGAARKRLAAGSLGSVRAGLAGFVPRFLHAEPPGDAAAEGEGGRAALGDVA